MSNLEKASRLLRLMGWISLVISALIIISVAIPALATGSSLDELKPLLILAVFVTIAPILYLKTGRAVKQNKDWGKITGAILAAISLISFPVGTIFGAATLFYLKKGWSEQSGSAV